MKSLQEMTKDELIQVCVDYRASLESALRAVTPPEQRQGPTDTLHLMQDAARMLSLLYGPQVGFFILAAPFGDPQARANYTSNMDRRDAMAILVSFLRRNGKEESWMRHLLDRN